MRLKVVHRGYRLYMYQYMRQFGRDGHTTVLFWFGKIIIIVLIFVFLLVLIRVNIRELMDIPLKIDKNLRTTQALAYKTTEYKKYCVVYSYINASQEYLSGDHITLVLHSTHNYAYLLEEQIKQWDGGISIAFFVSISNHTAESSVALPSLLLQSSITVLNKLKEKEGSEKLNVHLFFEKGNFKKCPEIILKNNDINTDNINLKEFAPVSTLYPINVARNIARKAVQTKLFLSGDIENYFVQNFEPRMKNLANELILKKKQKTVLIHRRFELSDGIKIPPNKEKLKELYNKKKAIEFHKKVYYNGHKIPNITQWFKVPENTTHTTVFMITPYKNAEWEPQFVCDKQVPYHDESFPFRLRSNTHLANELCRANFTFAIVNDLFTVHLGIKQSETPQDKMFKQLSKQNNRYSKVIHSGYEELAKLQNIMKKKEYRIL